MLIFLRPNPYSTYSDEDLERQIKYKFSPIGISDLYSKLEQTEQTENTQIESTVEKNLYEKLEKI